MSLKTNVLLNETFVTKITEAQSLGEWLNTYLCTYVGKRLFSRNIFVGTITKNIMAAL